MLAKFKLLAPLSLLLTLAAITLGVLGLSSRDAHAIQADSPAAAAQVRVLIITGMDVEPAHDWHARTTALEKLLAEDPRFVVAVSEDPEYLASPKIHDYDVILLNFFSGKKGYPGQASRDNLVKYISDKGKGLFILHFACGNFHDWPEFNKIAGLVFTPKDRPGYHDRYRKFDVNITDPDHAAVKGMKPVLKAHDECYYCLGNSGGPYHIIATADSERTKRQHPMAFTVNYGKGRVFHTPLGHDARSVLMPDVAELIRRGLIWAAKK